MPKKPNQALRRWAVEQAMKWPQYSSGGGGGMMGGAPLTYHDSDVIGRAKKIEDYVTGKTK